MVLGDKVTRDRWSRWSALAGLALLLILVERMTVAQVFAAKSSATAARPWTVSARASGAQARALILGSQTPAAQARTSKLASAALARDPTIVDAVVAAGLVNELARRPAEAARLFRYSDALTRRDFATRLWLIEEAVRRDDIPGALRHYDIALRTSRSAPALLFPILVTAAAGSALTDPLSTTLAKRPLWSYQYMQQLAQTGTDLDAIADLYVAVRRRGGLVPDATIATAIGRMVDAGRYDAAWSLYATFNANAHRDGLRNGSFDGDSVAPTAFDWNYSTAPELTVESLLDREASVLRFQASSGAAGPAARQLLLLSPGAHRLMGTAFDMDEAAGGRAAFHVICAGRPAHLIDLPLPATPTGRSAFAGDFVVPSDCSAQWIELHVPPAEGAEPRTGSVGRLSIR